VVGIPLALYWLTRSSKPVTRVVMALVGLLLIFGIILTESRGGFVALAAVMALNFLRKPSFKRVLPGVLLASSLLILAPHSYWTRMNTLLTGHEPHGGVSFADRFTLLKFGLKTLANRPILGVGPGNYGQALFRDTRKLTGLQPNDPYPVAHNTYLQFFDENGIIAGVLFVAIFFWAAVCFLKYDRANPPQPGEFPLGFSFASGFAGLLIACLFLSEGPNSVLWFMTGIGFATGKMAAAKAPLSRAGEAASCDYCSVSCR
jgi:putative inorganic carbon (hco3(-)) transporter